MPPDAAHGCFALVNSEEAAIGAAATRRILGTPSSIIAGQSGGGFCVSTFGTMTAPHNLGQRSASADLFVVLRTFIHSSIDRAHWPMVQLR